jgi:hypothetical protein
MTTTLPRQFLTARQMIDNLPRVTGSQRFMTPQLRKMRDVGESNASPDPARWRGEGSASDEPQGGSGERGEGSASDEPQGGSGERGEGSASDEPHAARGESAADAEPAIDTQRTPVPTD